MTPVAIQPKAKWRYRVGGSHKSSHNTGRLGVQHMKHSYWTDPAQWGAILNNRRVPASIPQEPLVLVTNKESALSA